jgi:hypothetical protein
VITKNEYWILDVVREIDWYSISQLASRHPDLSLDRDPHGMSRDELKETLRALFEQGYLIATRSIRIPIPGSIDPETGEEDWVGGSEDFVPNADDIRDALRGKFNHVRLTAQGGAVWEAVARPDWSKYSTWEYGGPADNDAQGVDVEEICAANRDLLEKYIARLPAWTEGLGVEYKLETLNPWQATYWKTLPIGYRVRVVIPRSNTAAYLSRQREDPVYQSWNNEYVRLWNEWYTNPFKEK